MMSKEFIFTDPMHVERSQHSSNDETEHRHHNLLKDCDQGLYPDCKNFNFFFLVHLFHLKYLNGWFSKSFIILKLLKDAFP